MDNDRLLTIGAIALNALFGNRPGISRNILSALGMDGGGCSPDRIGTQWLSGNEGSALVPAASLERAEREYEALSGMGYGLIGIFDPRYPRLLRECPDAPFLLYVRSSSGPEDIFSDRTFISIVGTRDISPYGRHWCREIVRALADSGARPTIVSGLAFGTDICAHEAALEFGLPTIGVIPTGIDTVYPKSHSGRAERIARSPSCAIVTDYPPGSGLFKSNFLRRNRIIAGLSRCTILIESRVKGGGMMTARLASGYGRELYVLPGRIDDLRSGGCNLLMADKLAEPLISVSALCTTLGLVHQGKRGSGTGGRDAFPLPDGYDGEDRELALRLLRCIREHPGCDADMICATCGLEYGPVSAMLERLEGEGIISSDLLGRCGMNVKFD